MYAYYKPNLCDKSLFWHTCSLVLVVYLHLNVLVVLSSKLLIKLGLIWI